MTVITLSNLENKFLDTFELMRALIDKSLEEAIAKNSQIGVTTDRAITSRVVAVFPVI